MSRSAPPGPAPGRPLSGYAYAGTAVSLPLARSNRMASGWSSTTATTGTGSRAAVSTGSRSAEACCMTTAIRAPTPA